MCQQLMAKLFVGDGKRAAAITKYSGRGKLSAWVQSLATRHVHGRMRRRRPKTASSDALIERAIETDDPELDVLKRRYRAEFKSAFEQAFLRLTVRQRNLLRHEFIDGLSIDKLGALYGVHRATAARWRAQCRVALLEHTRAIFETEHRVSMGELDSIVRLIRSQLNVSLSRLLRQPESKPPSD